MTSFKAARRRRRRSRRGENKDDEAAVERRQCGIAADLKTRSNTRSLIKWPRSRSLIAVVAAVALLLLVAAVGRAPATPARHFRRAHADFQRPFQQRLDGHFNQQQQQQDLVAADQMDEPLALDANGELLGEGPSRAASAPLGHSDDQAPAASTDGGDADGYSLDGASNDQEGDEATESGSRGEAAPLEPHAGGLNFLRGHNSHLRAMRDMFERRQLNHNNNRHHHHTNGNSGNFVNQNTNRLGQSSQELSPISIGLDPNSPFSMPPFAVGGEPPGAGPPPPPPPPMLAPHPKHAADGLEQPGALPFGLNPLPHLLGGFQSNFEGPQRGDQSAHANHHAAASSQSAAEPELGPSQKVWPKIFRFTDGRINLSDFEKQKKIRLGNKSQLGDNHIESAPIMFDGRQLKRKSFLILHGGVFSGNRRR